MDKSLHKEEPQTYFSVEELSGFRIKTPDPMQTSEATTKNFLQLIFW